MKCAIYARVSTKREEQRNSLKNQIAYAKELANSHGFTIVKVYVDDGISGASIQNREQITQLLEDISSNKFDVIIAKSVSRLGRNMKECYELADEIEKANIRLILPEDSYDTKTSDSRLTFYLKAIFAEEENLALARRIKIGLQASAKEGKYKASIPAFGYKVNPETRKLELDEIFSPIVKEIFNLYLYQDWGMFKIGNYLMEKNIPTPRTVSGASNAGSRWHQNSIKNILTNPIYTGALVQHREETSRFLSDSGAYKKRNKVDPDKQITIPNNHPAIITEDEFKAIQEKMKKKGRNKSNGQEHLFAHIAKCADCKCGMTYRADRRKGAYVCGGYVKHKSSYCSSHIIEEKVLLKVVKDDLRELIKENVALENLYGIAEQKANTQQTDLLKALKATEKRLNQLNKQFESLLNLHAEGAITTELFKQKNDIVAEEQANLNSKRAELLVSIETRNDLDNQLQAFRKEVERFANLDIDDEKVLKQVLQRLIEKIEVYEGGKIIIHYNIAPPLKISA